MRLSWDRGYLQCFFWTSNYNPVCFFGRPRLLRTHSTCRRWRLLGRSRPFEPTRPHHSNRNRPFRPRLASLGCSNRPLERARHRLGARIGRWSPLGPAGANEIKRLSQLRFVGEIQISSSRLLRFRWGAQDHRICWFRWDDGMDYSMLAALAL